MVGSGAPKPVVQRQDINLGLAEPAAARVAHDLERLPGVMHVESFRGAAVRIHYQGRNRQIGLRSLEPGSLHSRAVDHSVNDPRNFANARRR